MNQLRILHCNNDNKNMGGAYLVTRNLEPYIREFGYIFDYVTMDEFVVSGNTNTDPLQGTNTFSARLRKHKLFGHLVLPFFIKNILKNNPYHIVHIDIDSAWKALLYAIPSKVKGSKVLIHSHASGIDGNHKGLKGFLHYLCKRILAHYTDKYVGCSKEALQWLCPRKHWDKAEILINGIDQNKFFYEKSVRNSCRKELGLDEQFVLCNVARINDNKNQVFLVDVLSKIKLLMPNAVLMVVGPYTNDAIIKLKEKIKANQLENSVIIVGPTSDVNKYMNGADFFLLPSHFEGLSLVSIEAQRTGLKCILSTGTPPEAVVTNLAERVTLSLGAERWAQMIYERRLVKDRGTIRLDNKYTMEGMARHLARIYNSILKE